MDEEEDDDLLILPSNTYVRPPSPEPAPRPPWTSTEPTSASAMADPTPPNLRILCFGNSLTAGYHRWGTGYKPYSEKLCSTIESALPHLKVGTVVNGRPGDLVVGGNFLPRMTAQYKKPDSNFDWAIILGGTNDLAYGKSAEDIFAGLQAIYNIALSHGAKVLALTVPEVGVKSSVGSKLDASRNALNAMIFGERRENFYAFDLHKAVPYWSLSEVDKERYWDDRVHLAPDGYDLMGKIIGECMVELLKETTG